MLRGFWRLRGPGDGAPIAFRVSGRRVAECIDRQTSGHLGLQDFDETMKCAQDLIGPKFAYLRVSFALVLIQ